MVKNNGPGDPRCRVRDINIMGNSIFQSIFRLVSLPERALPEMARKAIGMLLKPQWAEKLVFEFAEDIDVTKDKKIPETMRHLRNTGCRLFLDDCFSIITPCFLSGRCILTG